VKEFETEFLDFLNLNTKSLSSLKEVSFPKKMRNFSRLLSEKLLKSINRKTGLWPI
jgi:hypothetical protein